MFGGFWGFGGVFWVLRFSGLEFLGLGLGFRVLKV